MHFYFKVPLGFRKACLSEETQQSPSSPHSGAQEQSTKGGDIKNMEINKYRVHKRVFNFRKPAAPHTIGGRDVFFCTSDLRWHGSKDEGLIGGPGQGGKDGSFFKILLPIIHFWFSMPFGGKYAR